MFKIIGISDDCTECCQCGRTNLKKTVVIENEEGIENYYGTECAAKLLKVNKKDVIKTIKAELTEQKRQAEELQHKQYKQLESARQYAKNHPEYIKEAEILRTNYTHGCGEAFTFEERLSQYKKVEGIYKKLFNEYLKMYPEIIKY